MQIPSRPSMHTMASPIAIKPQQNINLAPSNTTNGGNDNQDFTKTSIQQQKRIQHQQLAEPHLGGIINFYG
jgi:hypothetical protein